MSKFIESGLLPAIYRLGLDLRDLAEKKHQTELYRTKMHAAMSGLQSPEAKEGKLKPGALEVPDVFDQVAAHRFHKMVATVFPLFQFDWLAGRAVQSEGKRLVTLLEKKLHRLRDREIRRDPRQFSYGEQPECNEGRLIVYLIRQVAEAGIAASATGYRRMHGYDENTRAEGYAQNIITGLEKGLEKLPDEISPDMSEETAYVVCFALKSLSHDDFLMMVPALRQQNYSPEAITNVERLLFNGGKSRAVLLELLNEGREGAGIAVEDLGLKNPDLVLNEDGELPVEPPDKKKKRT